MSSTPSSTGSNLLSVRTLAPVALGATLISADSASAQIVSRTFFDPAVRIDTTMGDSNTSFGIEGLTVNQPAFELSATAFKPATIQGGVETKPAKPATASLATVDERFLISWATAGSLIDSDTFFYGGAERLVEGTNYIGFSFTEGTTLYGWVSTSLSIQNDVAYASVTGWAYNAKGDGILVGQTAIPEPATTAAAIAVVAGSAAMWHRRRQIRSAKAA